MISDAQKCVDEIKQLFPLSHLVSYMNARIRESEGIVYSNYCDKFNWFSVIVNYQPVMLSVNWLELTHGSMTT